MMLLQAQDLTCGYSQPVVQHLNFSLQAGDLLCVLGTNGAGKSTLLRTCAGILTPQSGGVFLGEHKVHKLADQVRGRLVAYVPQHLGSSSLNVYDAVLLGRTPHIRFLPGKKDHFFTQQALERLCMSHWAERSLDELSGGEKQKVALARALAQQAPVVILDEPTASLDIRQQLEVYALLADLCQNDGLCCLVAEHDVDLAANHASQVCLLHQGGLLALGQCSTVLTSKNISAVYGVDAHIQQESTGLRVRIQGISQRIPQDGPA